MDTITRITIKGSRALIEAGGEVRGWIRKSTLAELGWNEGDPLDEAAWDRAMEGPEFRAALEEGARYLASPRSRREVLRKLAQRGYPESVCERAAQRLESCGYIEDGDLARRAVESYASRGEGRRRIQQRLVQRGIDRTDIESALSDYDDASEKENAKAEAAKLMRKYASLDDQTARRRLIAALTRRGFSWESISAAIGPDDEEI